MRWLVGGALAATLVLWLAHASVYAFVTDDAYISFRYARNLAEGHGLVFNDGEHVEGYTNLLWVLLLAALSVLGADPSQAALPLSLLATVGLWACVAAYGARVLRPGEHRLWIALPCLLLALTRSVAVWSTSGLETRLFELLVVAGALSLVARLAVARAAPAPSLVIPAALLALATLTRPDGLLVAGSCAVVGGIALMRRPGALGRIAPAALLYAAVVGGHFLARYAYYGDWLPNTYYAKVSGQDWLEYGGWFALAFGREYWVVLWIVPLALALFAHVRRGTWFVPGVFLAVVLPHAAYIVSIGGDHFEYRPFDLYFPFLLMLVADGLRFAATGFVGGALALSYAALLACGLVAIPLQTHREFPAAYEPGFPGQGHHLQLEFGDPSRGLFGRFQPLPVQQRHYQENLWALSTAFVALRAEEHAGFVRTVLPEGALLRDAVARGVLPPDTWIALDTVGAIPYLSRLKVLDRNGLTDHDVGHGRATRHLMAHAKGATRDYATRMGVELWAVGPVHFVYADDDRRLAAEVRRCREHDLACFIGRLDEGHLLLAELLQGPESAARRFPRVGFVSVDDRPALYELGVPY
jgi:hypothetical protein